MCLVFTFFLNWLYSILPPTEAREDHVNYLVHTSGCSIPAFDVLDPRIAEFKVLDPIPVSERKMYGNYVFILSSYG